MGVYLRQRSGDISWSMRKWLLTVIVIIITCFPLTDMRRCRGRSRVGSSCVAQCNFRSGKWEKRCGQYDNDAETVSEPCTYYCQTSPDEEAEVTACSYEYTGVLGVLSGSCLDEGTPCSAANICNADCLNGGCQEIDEAELLHEVEEDNAEYDYYYSDTLEPPPENK